MTFSRLTQIFRRFRRGEDGSMTVEFVIFFPLLLMILFSTIEIGMILLRGSMLERALDMTVRELRLGTGHAMQHDEIRNTICNKSGFIDHCETSLRLEMVQVDPFDWTAINSAPDCVDSVEEVQPVRSFVNGESNELMFIRACMKFDPMFPTWGLGNGLAKDAEGRVKLYASTAFVQEPR